MPHEHLDYSAVGPYADHLGDGLVQMSFTLPVPYSLAARRAALELAGTMGFEEPEVVHYEQVTPGYTYFVMYGRCAVSVDFASLQEEGFDIEYLSELVEMVEAEGRRRETILACGGPRVTNELAKELGYDAGFSKGTYPHHLASFIVRELAARAAVPR